MDHEEENFIDDYEIRITLLEIELRRFIVALSHLILLSPESESNSILFNIFIFFITTRAYRKPIGFGKYINNPAYATVIEHIKKHMLLSSDREYGKSLWTRFCVSSMLSPHRNMGQDSSHRISPVALKLAPLFWKPPMSSFRNNIINHVIQFYKNLSAADADDAIKFQLLHIIIRIYSYQIYIALNESFPFYNPDMSVLIIDCHRLMTRYPRLRETPIKFMCVLVWNEQMANEILIRNNLHPDVHCFTTIQTLLSRVPHRYSNEDSIQEFKTTLLFLQLSRALIISLSILPKNWIEFCLDQNMNGIYHLISLSIRELSKRPSSTGGIILPIVTGILSFSLARKNNKNDPFHVIGTRIASDPNFIAAINNPHDPDNMYKTFLNRFI